MAYFLKKSKNKKGSYLQIYESFYDPARKHTAHRSIKPIGYEHELKASGIEDPIAYYKAQVDAMNAKGRVRRPAIAPKGSQKRPLSAWRATLLSRPSRSLLAHKTISACCSLPQSLALTYTECSTTW